ncbi:MAG: ribonuclease HII [Alphaproteobacteria bacterium]|nr:ribonuclease HII [Alphaproteobacteria bacterium]
MVDFRFEARAAGPVAGVDEAGRGPLAGPVVAAAVILDPGRAPKGLNDSKKLTPARREALDAAIRERAIAFAVAIVSAAEIDRINIRQASLKAMSEAVRSLSIAPAHVLVDGNALPALPCAGEAIIKGDGLSASIAAASILAKVARDRLMVALADLYPQYGFEGHKGYPSPSHRAALAQYGPCPEHRRSFAPVRSLLTQNLGASGVAGLKLTL